MNYTLIITVTSWTQLDYKKIVKVLKLKKKNPNILVLLTREMSNFFPHRKESYYVSNHIWGWMRLNSVDKTPVFQMLILNKSPNFEETA